ncbi:hypothetical protein VPH35_063938 [Triticum aestivum]
MEEEAAATAAVSIPNKDVLLEIVVRVKDAVALFRCATVCKQWHALITEPSFLRRRWPADAPCTFVGLFIREVRNWEEDRRPSLSWEHCFIPASFVTNAPAGLCEDAVPLVSRHGFVVVDLRLRDARGYRDNSVHQLAVCNFLVDSCHTLPPLKFGSSFRYCNSNGYAILTGADCHSKDEPSPSPPTNSSFFKVAIISCEKDDYKYNLHVFSSYKATWSVHTHCFGSDAQSLSYEQFTDAVVCHGMVHWVYRHYVELYCYVINLNPQTGHISWTKLPSEMYCQIESYLCLTLSVDGALSMAWMQSSAPQLAIWEQENKQNIDITSEWVCTRTIELKQPEKETPGRELCVLREKCGTLLISDSDHRVYTADLETRMMEEVVDWHHDCYFLRSDVMPLEIDWPTIFVSRLSM